MPQFAVLIYHDDTPHKPGETGETSADIAVCDDHADSLRDAGRMVGAWAFTEPHEARSVRASGVSEGTFYGSDAPTVAGFYLLDAPDLESAVATAATNPVVRVGGGVEVRPIHSGGLV